MSALLPLVNLVCPDASALISLPKDKPNKCLDFQLTNRKKKINQFQTSVIPLVLFFRPQLLSIESLVASLLLNLSVIHPYAGYRTPEKFNQTKERAFSSKSHNINSNEYAESFQETYQVSLVFSRVDSRMEHGIFHIG